MITPGRANGAIHETSNWFGWDRSTERLTALAGDPKTVRFTRSLLLMSDRLLPMAIHWSCVPLLLSVARTISLEKMEVSTLICSPSVIPSKLKYSSYSLSDSVV